MKFVACASHRASIPTFVLVYASLLASDFDLFAVIQSTAKILIVSSDPHRYWSPTTACPCLKEGVSFKWTLFYHEDAYQTAVEVPLIYTDRRGWREQKISALSHSSLHETYCKIRTKINKNSTSAHDCLFPFHLSPPFLQLVHCSTKSGGVR